MAIVATFVSNYRFTFVWYNILDMFVFSFAWYLQVVRPFHLKWMSLQFILAWSRKVGNWFIVYTHICMLCTVAWFKIATSKGVCFSRHLRYRALYTRNTKFGRVRQPKKALLEFILQIFCRKLFCKSFFFFDEKITGIFTYKCQHM